MPKILIQGRWKFGRLGNSGRRYETCGTSGRLKIAIAPPPHPGHPTSTGTMVDDWSPDREVVSQVLVLQSEFVVKSSDKFGGASVTVEVISDKSAVVTVLDGTIIPVGAGAPEEPEVEVSGSI